MDDKNKKLRIALISPLCSPAVRIRAASRLCSPFGAHTPRLPLISSLCSPFGSHTPRLPLISSLCSPFGAHTRRFASMLAIRRAYAALAFDIVAMLACGSHTRRVQRPKAVERYLSTPSGMTVTMFDPGAINPCRPSSRIAAMFAPPDIPVEIASWWMRLCASR